MRFPAFLVAVCALAQSPAPKPTVYKAAPPVTALAFSPDGAWMAVSGYREILLHSMENGAPAKLAARLPGRAMRIHGLAFSADSKTLVATGGDPAVGGEVQVWDVPTKTLRHRSRLAGDTFFGVALSPDGTRAAFGGADKSIRIYDVVEGKQLRKMDHHEDWVFSTIFGIDGKRLVSVGRDRAAKLTDASTGAFVENVNLLRDSLTAVARHPRRDWVLIGGQDRIPYLYRMDRPRAMRIADDSTLIRKFPQQDGPILTVAFSPDGAKIAVGAESGDVRIYDAESGAELGRCSGHQGGTYALAFTIDGTRLAAAGFDGQVRLYGIDGKLTQAYTPVPLGETVARQ
jgi:WD40 repeat protein